MSAPKRTPKPSTNAGVQATNITAQALAVGDHAQAIVNQTNTSELPNELKKVFENLTQKALELPDGPEKNIATSAVTALENEAKLGDSAKEASVAKWLNFLAETAPDIWDVAIATFANPVAGLGVAFKKVADRIKAEKEKETQI